MTRFRLFAAAFLSVSLLLIPHPCRASVGPDGRASTSEVTGLKGSDFEAGSIPAFAADFELRREADNRLVLHGVLDGCHVWVQPKGSMMTAIRNAARSGDAAGTLNYGLQMGQLQAHAGAIETNDSTFGSLLGAASRVPLPNSAPACGTGGLTVPALILAVTAVAVAIVIRFKRPSS